MPYCRLSLGVICEVLGMDAVAMVNNSMINALQVLIMDNQWRIRQQSRDPFLVSLLVKFLIVAKKEAKSYTHT